MSSPRTRVPAANTWMRGDSLVPKHRGICRWPLSPGRNKFTATTKHWGEKHPPSRAVGVSSTADQFPLQISSPPYCFFSWWGPACPPAARNPRQGKPGVIQSRGGSLLIPLHVVCWWGAICAPPSPWPLPRVPPKSLGMVWGSLGGSLLWTGATGSCMFWGGGGPGVHPHCTMQPNTPTQPHSYLQVLPAPGPAVTTSEPGTRPPRCQGNGMMARRGGAAPTSPPLPRHHCRPRVPWQQAGRLQNRGGSATGWGQSPELHITAVGPPCTARPCAPHPPPPLPGDAATPECTPTQGPPSPTHSPMQRTLQLHDLFFFHSSRRTAWV